MDFLVNKNAYDSRYADGDTFNEVILLDSARYRDSSSAFFSSKDKRNGGVYLSSLKFKLLADNEEDMRIVSKKDVANAAVVARIDGEIENLEMIVLKRAQS